MVPLLAICLLPPRAALAPYFEPPSPGLSQQLRNNTFYIRSSLGSYSWAKVSEDGCMGMCSVQLHRALFLDAWKGLSHGLMICCHHLEIFNHF